MNSQGPLFSQVFNCTRFTFFLALHAVCGKYSLSPERTLDLTAWDVCCKGWVTLELWMRNGWLSVIMSTNSMIVLVTCCIDCPREKLCFVLWLPFPTNCSCLKMYIKCSLYNDIKWFAFLGQLSHCGRSRSTSLPFFWWQVHCCSLLRFPKWRHEPWRDSSGAMRCTLP